jgi:hypothetical protein
VPSHQTHAERAKPSNHLLHEAGLQAVYSITHRCVRLQLVQVLTGAVCRPGSQLRSLQIPCIQVYITHDTDTKQPPRPEDAKEVA